MKASLIALILLAISTALTGCKMLTSYAACPNRDSEANRAALAEFRNLLFADQPLDELTAHIDLKSGSPDDAWHLFAAAQVDARQNNAAGARQSLRRILAQPDPDARTLLWSWKALRDLGDLPPPQMGSDIIGVVLELPAPDGVNTLAAYADGRARYLDGCAGVVVWEKTADRQMSALIDQVIEAAGPLVSRTPLVDRHLASSDQVVRLSLLTFSGIHVLEVPRSGLTQEQMLHPVLDAGGRLQQALEQAGRESQPAPY